MRKQINLLQQYQSFTGSQNAKFFDPENLKKFIRNHPDKGKNLLITHLSESLKQVSLFKHKSLEANFNTNNFKLKDRLDFRNLGSSTSRTKRFSEVEIFDLQHFKRLYDMHVLQGACNNPTNQFNMLHQRVNNCRAFLQAALAIRFGNTLDLKETKIISKRCDQCSYGTTCKYPNAKCLDEIWFNKSKTTGFKVYMLPQVSGCYSYLKRLEGNVSANYNQISLAYNDFLKVNFNLSSPKLRKFLVNLEDVSATTNNLASIGNWASDRVMKVHYLQNANKYIQLYRLLESW